MKMTVPSLLAAFLCCIGSFSIASAPVSAQERSAAVVFFDSGFPSADSASPSHEQLEKMFPGARFAKLDQFDAQLGDPSTRLLVLPYASAFPEQAWTSIFGFLEHGGNLLVLGGRAFSRAAYRDSSGWHLRDYSVRFMRPLMIDQYQITPGSEGLNFQTNPDVTLQPKPFVWKRAFSPIIRLSAVDLYNRGGSAGSIDARLDALAWGTKDGRRLAAPLIQVDHLRNGFDGGRWIFLNADLTPDFYAGADAASLIRNLADRAAQGSEEFTVRPALPLYLPGEPVVLDLLWHPGVPPTTPLTARITTFPEGQPASRTVTTVAVPPTEPILLPAPSTKGFHIIETELLDGNKPRAIYRSAFWIRDEAFLRSGPRLSVNQDYFELDGQPLAVAGTTYMASDAQRLYFAHPNAYVWDQDLALIHSAGLNMIRTGWWTGWEKFCDENGQPYERTLRTIEAYLMTARKNGLPVQFNFFAFLPEVLGGANAYLDPEAVRRQQTLVSAVAARFHDVPYLAWDLINEPSISKHLWTMRPNDDPFELAKWNQWLTQRYPNRPALAAAWNTLPGATEGAIPLPQEIEFTPRGMNIGHNSLKLYDYFLFAQDSFADWVRAMREKIRGVGSRQLITVGQDEGGFVDRLSPAFFGPFVDFTTNHSWWQNDAVLWDSLVAKQPGKAMLIQETGLQRELNLDEVSRRTPESEAALLEKKIATSFVQGSGAIEWLWNSNSYMTEGNETPIGAVRPDGTEKPEASVLRAFAAFSKSVEAHLVNPQLPSVAIITSQAAQFSVLSDFQIEAQRKSVRALAYGARLAPYVIAENQIGKLGSPRLAILPSPQALTEPAWQSLLQYVDVGGNLLITGPLDHDEHWRTLARAADLKVDGTSEPLVYRTATIKLNDRTLPLSFSQPAQLWLDSLRFAGGAALKEIPYGKGRIFWAAYPVELADGLQPATELYSYVAGRIGLKPAFELQSSVSPGVLIYPTLLQDSVMYIMVSDSADDEQIDLRDNLTGARLALRLPGQHAAIALIGLQSKQVIVRYGF
jgi:hypothetical protein